MEFRSSTPTSPGDPSFGAVQKVTLGGVIKVVSKNGLVSFYGMSAGHGVEECQKGLADIGLTIQDQTDDLRCCDTDSSGDDDSDDDDDDDGGVLQSSHEDNEHHQPESHSFSHSQRSATWESLDTSTLGQMLDTAKLLQHDPENKRPSQDWALFDIDAPKPNELCIIGHSGFVQRQALLVAAQPSFHRGVSDPVAVISGSSGPRIGELSCHPTRILIGHNETFIDAYTLKLAEDNGTMVSCL